jgi:hypothetical protein
VSRSNALQIISIGFLLAGCHGPPIPETPGRGGPAWVELTSEHFVMWTDSSLDQARELLRRTEHLRQVVLGVAFPNDTTSNGKSFVLALRDADEVGAYIPEQFDAYAIGDGNPTRQPMILIPAAVGEREAHVITHELTHVISYNVIRNQPPWFAEGIAEFFATVQLDSKLEKVDVGQPLADLEWRLRTQHLIPAAALFACAEPKCMEGMFYPTAWALFTFLANEHPNELLKLMDRLDRYPKEQQANAWNEVFPELTPDKLDHELMRWLAHGRKEIWHFNAQLKEWPISERKLSDADVLAARALLRQIFGSPKLDAELATALAADPTNLLARLVEAAKNKSAALDVARSVAAAHPDDWRSWWLVQIASKNGEEAWKAHEKACEWAPKDPSRYLHEMCRAQ